ncbi:4,5-DOPA dioxygenase extradiol [Salmonella enterica]|uniref:4,5-DOPA dioxygenase extradiol n=5 Tax=Salmonella enterica TaxID=28901 RepID=A0A6C8MLH7_SALER|nr:4,5-DOPA dioxygenase extradiol [Salmonella enterica subsp. arizonae]EAN8470643.1 4,5-DOPA dioxygenase extradiol [Salmonella enterica]EAT8924111.1 4,5-DOPA dioxygenase extradiol [Salmonella enterica subsp. arizonae serovar 63:z4,z32:-]EAV6587130.1 4,5-DOPA dioxygenase extradiol [Salmonella enterica subsp. arizonae serovar 63:z4,z23:-]EAW2114353.1 4,5-DOPA dioxygenase extradiol [Salmonella enterica subsp. enterica]EDR5866469.1 4,5-DOPA dioxygenase extradiol [Salmonella enterica subsp. arizona
MVMLSECFTCKDNIMSLTRMPALFLGHGSTMNVLDDNDYTHAWQRLGEALPRPQAIVVVSAHRYTRGTGVTAMERSQTLHDFGGFPQALYDTHYPAPGSPALAQRLVELLAPVPVALDKEAWGFDHGSWGVLIKMYPNADIPMVQLSVDSTKPAAWHFEVGRKLTTLRDEGGALSNPTPDHYLPLLYVLGAWDGKESITIPTDGIEMGSLSMLSVQVG